MRSWARLRHSRTAAPASVMAGAGCPRTPADFSLWATSRLEEEDNALRCIPEINEAEREGACRMAPLRRSGARRRVAPYPPWRWPFVAQVLGQETAAATVPKPKLDCDVEFQLASVSCALPSHPAGGPMRKIRGGCGGSQPLPSQPPAQPSSYGLVWTSYAFPG